MFWLIDRRLIVHSMYVNITAFFVSDFRQLGTQQILANLFPSVSFYVEQLSSKEMDLANKIALITGGANGLGFGFAEGLLHGGVKHVAIVDLKTSNGEESTKKLNSKFGEGRAIFVACDVIEVSELKAAFAKTVKEFGGLDIVINNAGLLNERRWELMTNVNINGVIRGTYLGLEYMGKQNNGKGGIIVNIASIAGLEAFPWLPVYTATKHAIIGLSRSFGVPYYYEKTGVRIVTLCPGFTETQLVANIPNMMPELVEVDVAMTALSIYPRQETADVVQCIAQVIKSAKNGSFWLCEGGKPVREIFFAQRTALETPPK